MGIDINYYKSRTLTSAAVSMAVGKVFGESGGGNAALVDISHRILWLLGFRGPEINGSDKELRRWDMPLTYKGKEIMSAMEKQYGAEKGKKVFYASRNAGKIKGVEGKSKKKK